MDTFLFFGVVPVQPLDFRRGAPTLYAVPASFLLDSSAEGIALYAFFISTWS